MHAGITEGCKAGGSGIRKTEQKRFLASPGLWLNSGEEDNMDTFLTIAISAVIGAYIGAAGMVVCCVRWMNQKNDRR